MSPVLVLPPFLSPSPPPFLSLSPLLPLPPSPPPFLPPFPPPFLPPSPPPSLPPSLCLAVECDWPNTSENHRRKEFCSRYEGYGALCHCANPLPLNIRAPRVSTYMHWQCYTHPQTPSPSLSLPLQLVNNNIANVPVSIIASNRPLYLFR